MRIALLRRLSLLLPALAVSLLAACGSGDRDEREPLLEISSEITDFEDKPISISSSSTNVQNIIIKGQVEPGASLEVTLDTAPDLDIEEDLGIVEDGKQAWSARLSFKEGTNTIKVTATDKAGNSLIIRMSIIFDMTPPALTVNAPTSPVSTPSVELSGTREKDASIVVTVDPEATVGAIDLSVPDAWKVAVSNLAGEVNTVTITAIDVAGNETETQVTIELDITAPSVTELSPAEGATGVALDVEITAIFDEAIAANTVSPATFLLLDPGGIGVAAEATYVEETRQAILAPTDGLAPGVTYTVVLSPTESPITDLAGNSLAEKYWSFTTTAQ